MAPRLVVGGTASPAAITISNTQQFGPILPLTGGAGGLLFTVIGGGLALAGVGAILGRRLLARRR